MPGEQLHAISLQSQTSDLTASMLVHLATLGDHLGLSTLCHPAAEALVQKSWLDNTESLTDLLQLSTIRQNQEHNLLHQSDCGAYSELQLLDLLELQIDTDIANLFKLEASSRTAAVAGNVDQCKSPTHSFAAKSTATCLVFTRCHSDSSAFTPTNNHHRQTLRKKRHFQPTSMRPHIVHRPTTCGR